MKQRIHRILITTPLFLRVVLLYVVIGAGGLCVSAAPPAQAAPVPAPVEVSAAPVPVEPVITHGIPRRIELPRIGLARAVIDGRYDAATQTWTLTDDKAQYATMTTPPNDSTGQTVIYGHNTSAVLEPVRLVAPADELLVTTDNGHTFVYVYSHDRFVDPADTSVLYEASKTPRVVLMTCEGWLSATRRLLYFDFKEVR